MPDAFLIHSMFYLRDIFFLFQLRYLQCSNVFHRNLSSYQIKQFFDYYSTIRILYRYCYSRFKFSCFLFQCCRLLPFRKPVNSCNLKTCPFCVHVILRAHVQLYDALIRLPNVRLTTYMRTSYFETFVFEDLQCPIL